MSAATTNTIPYLPIHITILSMHRMTDSLLFQSPIPARLHSHLSLPLPPPSKPSAAERHEQARTTLLYRLSSKGTHRPTHRTIGIQLPEQCLPGPLAAQDSHEPAPSSKHIFPAPARKFANRRRIEEGPKRVCGSLHFLRWVSSCGRSLSQIWHAVVHGFFFEAWLLSIWLYWLGMRER
jgi:hypothetical protein